MKHYEFPCLALKPRWAREIYNREKFWEFRLRPLPLQVPMAVYESAPVKQITGVVAFDAIVAAPLDGMLGLIAALRSSGNAAFVDSYVGSVSRKMLVDYAGSRTIFAHHVGTSPASSSSFSRLSGCPWNRCAWNAVFPAMAPKPRISTSRRSTTDSTWRHSA